jgi:hypothetical protein
LLGFRGENWSTWRAVLAAAEGDCAAPNVCRASLKPNDPKTAFKV